MRLPAPIKSRDGFTMLEMLLAVIISAFIFIGIYKIFGACQSVQSAGVDMADAQQNARIAMDMMERDLRIAGYGIPSYIQTPVVVASEYRVTFVKDTNNNGTLDLGETITYFLDPNTADFQAAVTPNPRDMVLRRIVSDNANPAALPISGYGHVVAANITQQIDGDGNLDVPMFEYFDSSGNSLVDYASDDPFSAALGHTVSDSMALGLPVGGPNEPAISSITIAVVAESEAPDRFLKDYGRVVMSTSVAPRNLPANLP